MKVRLPRSVRLGLILVGASLMLGGSPPVGEDAPELTPSQWLNRDGPLSWEQLTGRIILVEKWATW